MNYTKVENWKRTSDEFKDAVKKNNLKKYKLRECSICGTPLYYRFVDGQVLFNSSCACVPDESPDQMRSYQEIADLYNSQSSKEVIDSLDKYFGFKSNIEE